MGIAYSRQIITIALCVIISSVSYVGLFGNGEIQQKLQLDRTYPNGNAAYSVQVDKAPWFGFTIESDSETSPTSTLRVLENGTPLGPAHAGHDQIRAVGKGLYSHWGGWVIFSASDNSDPRTNGRDYRLIARQTIQPWLRLSLMTALLGAAFVCSVTVIHLLSFVVSAVGFRSGRLDLRYRPEIDGLRFIAVSAVGLFHLGFKFIPAGFVGVDVFFVISGFLITGRIVSDLDNDKFSIIGFYHARILRIFPALVVIIAATLIAGFLFLLPGDYINLASSADFAVLATSNIYFLLHTGYFDAQSELMPLLHTWSLGVEEQFYLIWPMLLLGTYTLTRSRRWIVSVLMLVAVASLAVSILQTSSDPKAAFYLPFARAWEFCAGAFVALIPLPIINDSQRGSVVAGTLGIGLIAFAAFYFTSETPFPGVAAVIPVLGAALLVAPSRFKSPVTFVLQKPTCVFLGRISYCYTSGIGQ